MIRVIPALLLVVVCGASLAGAAAAVIDVAGPGRGLAVVPFTAVPGGSSQEAEALPDVAALLADQLAERSGSRIVAPHALRHDARGLDDPQAQDVRRWAEWNDVADVIVGRTLARGNGGLDVAVELRSGHSGAARAEYRLAPASQAELGEVVSTLAELILADLGEAAETASDVLPPVAAPVPDVPGRPSEGAGAEAATAQGDGIGLALLPAARRDDPISINSDELEVLPQAGGRRLVFSRNVEVLQGDISLTADRLEAVYPPGASQPDLLLASGRVRVSQGDRRGSCEEARYERASQTIVCRGRAEVVQGCDRVRGEEIEFDLEHERVKVSGAASVVIQPEDSVAGACGESPKVGAETAP
jgi:lipopolysaccharide export system protein LptA